MNWLLILALGIFAVVGCATVALFVWAVNSILAVEAARKVLRPFGELGE